MKNLVQFIDEALVKTHIDTPAIPENYVDLGLKSGVKWAVKNYNAVYDDDPGERLTQKQALFELKLSLPSPQDFRDLYNECTVKNKNGVFYFYSKVHKDRFISFVPDHYWTSENSNGWASGWSFNSKCGISTGDSYNKDMIREILKK